MITNLMIAGTTLRAGTANADKRQRYTFAALPAQHVFADGNDDTGLFMSGNVGQSYIGIMPPPTMPVAVTKAGGPNLQHDTMIARLRVRRIFNSDWP